MTDIIGTLIYKITGDTSSLDTKLSKSKKQIVNTGTSIEKLGKQIKTVSTTVISGVLVKSLIEASSRAQELENKFNTVFNGLETETNRFVENYTNATSRGKIATKEFLATQQDLRTGYGDNVKSAALYSQAIVGITNDLASFSNVPIADAMNAMQSGMAFQFEALRRLGVNLSVATIEQGSYAKSINKTWLEMTNLEKQEAVLSGVVSQSSNALHQNIDLWTDYNYKLGDAALTADSFANSSQGMLQSLEDTKAEIGNNLIPLATDISNTVLTLSRGFNKLPDSFQLATTAAGVFGIALKALSTGPVGIAIGAAGALTVLLSNIKSSNERLTESTTTLNEQSNNYSNIVNKLSGDTSNLTKDEKALLEVRRDLAKAQIDGAMQELATSYDKQSEKVEKYTNKLNWAKGEYEAFKLAKDEGIDAVNNKINSLLSSDNLETEERAMLSRLQSIASDVSMNLYEINDTTFDKFYSDLAEKYEDRMDKLAKMENPMQSSINEIAEAVANDIIDISKYENTNKDLYDAINEVVESLKSQNEAQENVNTSTQEAIQIQSDYKDKIFENIAAEQEEKNNFQNAAALKKVILGNEKEAAIRKLAQDYEILDKEEDINKISISNLRKRIDENVIAKNELHNLDIYFNQEKEKIDQESLEKEQELIDEKKEAEDELEKNRTENDEEYAARLKEQNTLLEENKATELESSGKFEESYEIRKKLLNDELFLEKESLNKKIEEGSATNQALLDLEEYYNQKQASLLEEKNKNIEKAETEKLEKAKAKEEQLEKKREENSQKYIERLRAQNIVIDENTATELENSGKFEEAYDIRKSLLDDELALEIEELNKKIKANEASKDDLITLEETYSKKQYSLLTETNRKIEEANKEKNEKLEKENQEKAEKEKKIEEKLAESRKENSKKYLDLVEKQAIAIKEASADELENMGHIEEAYKIRKQLIFDEYTKEKEILLKKIEANKATQEDLTNLDKYYTQKQVDLYEEKNEKINENEENLNKELKEKRDKALKEAINSFNTYVNEFSSMVSAVSSYLDVLNQNQIDNLEKEKNKKLESLGLSEESEKEALQREYNEAIKNGDAKLAQEKLRALEKLKIEEEYDQKKKEIEIQQAKRNKKLKKYEAEISTLQAVIGFLANPGDWAGLALSAMAAATGAAQVAAIEATPLPSYDVGSFNITEDQIANIHQGEIIVPASMSESIRKGDAFLGSTNNSNQVSITIINNTGAKVETEESKNGNIKEYKIMIGKVINTQIKEGRYDTALSSRYDIRRRGFNA